MVLGCNNDTVHRKTMLNRPQLEFCNLFLLLNYYRSVCESLGLFHLLTFSPHEDFDSSCLELDISSIHSLFEFGVFCGEVGVKPKETVYYIEVRL